MPIVLSLKSESHETIELPIFSKTVIGRSNSADLKIDDTKISAKHCSFELTKKGEVMFTDLGSTNGSFLNNSAVTQTLVKIHDQIRIGDTTIKIMVDKLTTSEKAQIGQSRARFQPELTVPDITEASTKKK